MQPQRNLSPPPDLATEHGAARPELCVVATPRVRRFVRTLGVVTAALVATGGYVHLCLYRHGYRSIPKIGTGFLLQVVASAIVAAALLAGPRRVARLVRVTDGFAGTVTGLAAAALSTGTLAAFALTRTPGGLFNFQERGLQPSPQALVALVSEAGVLVVLAVWLAADHLGRRPARALPAAPV
jgi:hypothetical protein